MTVDQDTLSVGQLLRKSKNAIAREFRGPVWVAGEIRSLRDHRGNLYMTLVEPGDFADGSDVMVDVAAWPKRASLLRAQTRAAGIELVVGMQVRVSGQVTLSKTGRLTVELVALDVEALLGDQAAEKKRLYEMLRHENLIDANSSLEVPMVPLRIGLVTSEKSEGCNDFLGQLSRSRFDFEVSLHHSPVQGPAAPNAIARAIDSMDEVDVIAVVRGGGGELDAFDKEVVARAIAAARAPVFTGIGHTGDHSVADDVAHTSYVTPTECGQALVGRVEAYRSRLASCATRLCAGVSRLTASSRSELDHRNARLLRCVVRELERSRDAVDSSRSRLGASALRTAQTSASRLDFLRERVAASARADLQMHHAALSSIAGDLRASTTRRLDSTSEQAGFMQRHLRSVDPRRPLQRGFSLTHLEDGSLLDDPDHLEGGTVLVTEVARGKIRSVVEERAHKRNR